MGEFKVKFRGVRGSHPVASVNMMKYGGNTTCIEVRVNGHIIIIDAGTGVISLGNDLVKSYITSGTDESTRKPIEAVMLFSHAHHDHIQGFPFFKPAYIGTSRIYMFGAKSMGLDFGGTLSHSMFTPFFPVDLGEMAAHLYINNFKETEMLVLKPGKLNPDVREIHPINGDSYADVTEDDVVITCMKSYAHPKDGVMMFKILYKNHSIVYASDKESYIGGDRRLAAFARNADYLIHDAQYMLEDYQSPITPKQGYGHSTPEMAIETARLANVKGLILFHLDPAYDDKMLENLEENAKKQFYNSQVAYEGLEIDLL